MRKVVKLIFRVDYRVNYEFLDRPGRILKVLNENIPGYWSEVGEARDTRSISGRWRHPTNSAYRQISVEPKAIWGLFEDFEGLDLADVPNSTFFTNASETLVDIFKMLGISDLLRSGLRMSCIEDFGGRFEHPSKNFLTFLDKEDVQNFESKIGAIEDVSFTFVGHTQDKIGYRVTFGPGADSDLGSIFEHAEVPTVSEEPTRPHHLTADMDFFETNFSFAGLNLKKWANTKWPLANDLMDLAKNKMMLGRSK